VTVETLNFAYTTGPNGTLEYGFTSALFDLEQCGADRFLNEQKLTQGI